MESAILKESPPRKKPNSLGEINPTKINLCTLPDDILIEIFSYLDLKSIYNCAMVCSTLNNISKYSALYKTIHLKYFMKSHILKSFLSKATSVKRLRIEYNNYEYYKDQNTKQYNEFNKYVIMFLEKSRNQLKVLEVKNCINNKDVMLSLSECTNLEADNDHVDVNEICETLSQHNLQVTNILLNGRDKIKLDSLCTLKRLSNLKSLEIKFICNMKPNQENSLKQLAAGCSKLEKLFISGWRELNDDNFIPALPMLTHLTELKLSRTNITIKSCREVAFTLPRLKSMHVIGNQRVKIDELDKLQSEFPEIDIALYKYK